jgi:hypothetical protein
MNTANERQTFKMWLFVSKRRIYGKERAISPFGPGSRRTPGGSLLRVRYL